METLILHVNKLQEVCNTVGQGKIDLNLPQIVVVGSQSSGKTSVLESFVGKDFLPRGQNIVTRCPLILQLVHIDENVQEPQTGANEWAVFGHHKPPRIYTDFEQVKEEVEAQTGRITGSTKNISPQPIFLKVFSPKVVTLTLVDLPGLIKMPVEGQPADIGKRIKEMVREHISNPNTIILAVTPATADLATSHALSIAKDHDPEGDRTIAVLTKLDAVEAAQRGTMEQVLTEQILKVKLGIIGVVNRSQNDVVAKKSMAEKKLEERQFLQKTYPRLANENGTDVLANRLSQLLVQRILKWIPVIQEKISEGVSEHKALLESYSVTGERSDDKTVLFRAIDKFTRGVKDDVEGLTSGQHTKELEPGARIYQLFFTKYPAELDAIAKAMLNDDDISMAVKNAMSLTPHLFIPHRAFVNLVKYYIKETRDPSLLVAEETTNELKIIFDRSRQRMMGMLQMYPTLMKRLMEETEEFLETRLNETKNEIEKHVERELGYINVNHPDFDWYFDDSKSGQHHVSPNVANGKSSLDETGKGFEDEEQTLRNADKWPSVPTVYDQDGDDKSPRPARREDKSWKTRTLGNLRKNKVQNGFDDYQSTPNVNGDQSSWFVAPNEEKKKLEKAESVQPSKIAHRPAPSAPKESRHAALPRLNDISVIAKALKAYTTIVKKNASDMVLKIIMYHLINYTVDSLALHLHGKLNRPDLLPDLLVESSDLLEKKQNAEKSLQAYNEANAILNEIKFSCDGPSVEE